MASKKHIEPPKLTDERPYSDWVWMVKPWRLQRDLPAEKQGVTLASSLEGKALDAVLELEDNIISADDGVDQIITKLDDLFKKKLLNRKN